MQQTNMVKMGFLSLIVYTLDPTGAVPDGVIPESKGHGSIPAVCVHCSSFF